LKNPYSILVFLFLLAGCESPMKKTPASQKADSLAYFFEKANNDSVPYAERQLYTKKAIAVISKDKNDSMNRVNYFKVANRYYNIGDYVEYKKTTELIIENAILEKDTVNLVKAYSYLMDYYVKNNMLDSAYVYNYKVEKVYRNLKDNQSIALSLLNKAIMQHLESDYVGCERSVFEVLRLLVLTKNNELLYEANNLLGIIYGELKEYKLSYKYYNIALDIARSDTIIPADYQFIATTLNNLGVLYRDQNMNEEAIEKFNLALNQKNLSRDMPNTFAMIKDNLAYSKFKSGEYKELPDLFFEALKIRDSLNIAPGIIINKVHLSEYYAFKKDTLKAIRYAKEAYVLSDESNLKRDVLFSLKQLLIVDTAHAVQYAQEYFRINDSIQLAELRNRNKYARIEFETDELATEKDRLTQHKSTLVYISISILLLAFAVFIIRHQITKNKELKLLQQQQNANEEIYRLMLDQQQKIEEGRQLEKKRISRELHDGVMGRLSGIRLNLFVLGRKTDPETIAKSLDHISEIQEVEREIRTIAYDLEKRVFSDTVGFVTIVRNLFNDLERHSSVHFKLDVAEDIEWEVLSGNNKMNLYRILQESLQNIIKYADAHTVTLRMQKAGSAIAVTIEDDGAGFDVRKIKKGLGLKNMEERAAEMNATIDILSEEGRGTKINLMIPV